MNICLDARWIFPEISGIGLYTQELIQALARINHQHPITLLFHHAEVQERTRRHTRYDHNPLFTTLRVNYGPFSFQNQLRLPALLRRRGFDLYHSTNFMMPLPGGGKTRRAVTIHDLIPLLFPDHAPKSKKTRLFPVYRELMMQIGRRADLIITVSDSTRRDVLRELRIPEFRRDRVASIPEGVDPFFQPGEPAPPRREKVILYVGRRDPYKNLPRLVEALADVRAQGVPARLKVIGPQDARYPEAPDLAVKLGVQAAVDWIGYVTPEELRQAYQTADVFCLPSRYEGFGLTVLEAMACGAPVVCSNIGSLPEVAGHAARLVDPAIRTDLAQALAEVLTRPDLAADLRRRGLDRVRQFTWQRTAEQTLRAYEALA
jgi:glycosyltransferase involved in cell wall biosynthesis